MRGPALLSGQQHHTVSADNFVATYFTDLSPAVELIALSLYFLQLFAGK